MTFQNCILIDLNGQTDGRTDEQAQSNMPPQLFQSWGHKNEIYHPASLKLEIDYW